VALIRAARPDGLYANVVLSLLVGVRTEEARALRWDHVDLEGNPDAEPPVPPHVDVWRSVRPWELFRGPSSSHIEPRGASVCLRSAELLSCPIQSESGVVDLSH